MVLEVNLSLCARWLSHRPFFLGGVLRARCQSRSFSRGFHHGFRDRGKGRIGRIMAGQNHILVGKKRGEREGPCPQITGPMHADGKRKSSEFFICVHLRHLIGAIPNSVAAGRAARNVSLSPAQSPGDLLRRHGGLLAQFGGQRHLARIILGPPPQIRLFPAPPPQFITR